MGSFLIIGFIFAVAFGLVRDKAYVPLHTSIFFIIHVVVKGGIFDFIGCIRTKNWMVLCELQQGWFYFFANVQDLHVIFQCYEDIFVGVNPNVCSFGIKKTF